MWHADSPAPRTAPVGRERVCGNRVSHRAGSARFVSRAAARRSPRPNGHASSRMRRGDPKPTPVSPCPREPAQSSPAVCRAASLQPPRPWRRPFRRSPRTSSLLQIIRLRPCCKSTSQLDAGKRNPVRPHPTLPALALARICAGSPRRQYRATCRPSEL